MLSCLLHTKVIVYKHFEMKWGKVPSDATKMANFIKPRLVHSRMFFKLHEKLRQRAQKPPYKQKWIA